jgi:hypothetical protein
VPNSGVAIFNPGNDSGSADVDANGGDLHITGTAGTGGLTGVDGSFYFSGVDNGGAFFIGIKASGNLVVTSDAGLIHFVSSSTVSTASFNSPGGTSSLITWSDTTSAPVSLSGGDFTMDEYAYGVNYGTVNVTNLTITDNTVPFTNLGPVDTGTLTATLTGALNINGAITASGLVTLVDTGDDITFGTNGSINDSGTGGTGDVVLAAGTNLANSHYISNNSTSGLNAIQVAAGSNYYLYSSDPTYGNLGGLMPDFTLYTVSYPESGLPAGNGALYFAAMGAIGPNAPVNPPPDTGGGSTIVPPVLIPQPIPPGAPPFGGGTLGLPPAPPAPFSFTGDGSAGQTGQQNGGLANSSGNSGQITSGDTAQLNGGELNNVTNPEAAGALNQALGPVAYHSLEDALKSIGDYDAGDLPATNDAAGGGDSETILNGGEVAEIGEAGVKNIPPGQAPAQLKQAMGDGVLNGMPSGGGH